MKKGEQWAGHKKGVRDPESKTCRRKRRWLELDGKRSRIPTEVDERGLAIKTFPSEEGDTCGTHGKKGGRRLQ